MSLVWFTFIFILTQCKIQHLCFSWRRGPWRPMSTGAVKSQGGPASTPPLVSLVSFLLNGHFFSETPPISSQFMGSPAFFPYHSSISLLLWLQRRTCQRTVNWIDPAGSDCRVLSRTHPDTVLRISGFSSQDVPLCCLCPSGDPASLTLTSSQTLYSMFSYCRRCHTWRERTLIKLREVWKGV